MMRTLIGWTVGAACATVIVSGISAPVQGQDVKHERRDIETSRQQLRDAYRSGDPGAIKTARENYQKARNEPSRDKRRNDAQEPK
ncbi:MAG TPA: hypothetical protein VK547_12115 [Candidatus Udaeobacter sp.]|nr:hypothetical protein [Candidatus Udaeobacter sp.]